MSESQRTLLLAAALLLVMFFGWYFVLYRPKASKEEAIMGNVYIIAHFGNRGTTPSIKPPKKLFGLVATIALMGLGALAFIRKRKT